MLHRQGANVIDVFGISFCLLLIAATEAVIAIGEPPAPVGASTFPCRTQVRSTP
jgi:hypothetical protein